MGYDLRATVTGHKRPDIVTANPICFIHTDAAIFAIDEDGVCCYVTSATGEVPRNANRCRGAEYVACLDLTNAEGLVADPRIGGTGLFVGRGASQKMALLRTGPITRVEFVEDEDANDVSQVKAVEDIQRRVDAELEAMDAASSVQAELDAIEETELDPSELEEIDPLEVWEENEEQIINPAPVLPGASALPMTPPQVPAMTPPQSQAALPPPPPPPGKGRVTTMLQSVPTAPVDEPVWPQRHPDNVPTQPLAAPAQRPAQPAARAPLPSNVHPISLKAPSAPPRRSSAPPPSLKELVAASTQAAPPPPAMMDSAELLKAALALSEPPSQPGPSTMAIDLGWENVDPRKTRVGMPIVKLT